MQTQPLTINIPTPLYASLRERAEQLHRSVEEETLDVLAASLASEAGLPNDIEEEMASLQSLGDDELWCVARGRIPVEAADELERLHEKGQQGKLTAEESRRAEELLRSYERHMLLRAQGAAILKERGHDVSELLEP